MQRHFIFITSDANRTILEAGYCQDIALQLFEIQQSSTSFMAKAPKFSRIVYVEEFESFEAALRSKQQINQFTKMQKERLIRRSNPNWLSFTTNNTDLNRKVAIFA